MLLKFRISHEAPNKFVTYQSYFFGLPFTWTKFKSYAPTRTPRPLLPHEERELFYQYLYANDYTDTFHDEEAARTAIERELERIKSENERYERIRRERKAFKPNKPIIY